MELSKIFKIERLINGTPFITNYFKGISSNPKTIYIDIKFKHLQKIRQKRADGVEKGT